jgi:hypothetical protein
LKIGRRDFDGLLLFRGPDIPFAGALETALKNQNRPFDFSQTTNKAAPKEGNDEWPLPLLRQPAVSTPFNVVPFWVR